MVALTSHKSFQSLCLDKLCNYFTDAQCDLLFWTSDLLRLRGFVGRIKCYCLLILFSVIFVWGMRLINGAFRPFTCDIAGFHSCLWWTNGTFITQYLRKKQLRYCSKVCSCGARTNFAPLILVSAQLINKYMTWAQFKHTLQKHTPLTK